ncbi:hypothetical protein [Brucella pecoris]|uniref:Uncharacterized protein n=1 Tax=Brucella pecoris TaxID=867683 RepID=A0A5C5CIY3_9HYPH|nr:hypothetical protein [Brucella pecoris]MBB4094633.1 hypothetical protein [Brucella pecoris]TNV11419.1 hypothetical protein FIB18_14720 [Brucella pecoris]
MAVTKKQEARALNADEKELVEKSHHPFLQDVPDEELSHLAKLIRERRKKAKDQAHQRRREMRGKGAARGTSPSKADEGSHLKVSVLAMAVRRINTEVERRRRMSASAELIANARKALATKEANEKKGKDFNTRHALNGMRNIPNEKYDSLVRPAERGRLRKAASVAQAKKDTRQKEAG